MREVSPPPHQHRPAWDLSPTTSWHTRQPNIWLWLVPHFGSFHFLRALRTSKEGRGKPHPTALTGLESSQKHVGSSIQQCASTKHSLFNSCLQLYMSRLPSMSCWHSRCGLQSTQKWLVKENLFLSSSPLKIWGAFPVCFHSMQMAWEITTYVVEG